MNFRLRRFSNKKSLGISSFEKRNSINGGGLLVPTKGSFMGDFKKKIDKNKLHSQGVRTQIKYITTRATIAAHTRRKLACYLGEPPEGGRVQRGPLFGVGDVGGHRLHEQVFNLFIVVLDDGLDE